MRLKALGMIQKEGNWVPYELKSRDWKDIYSRVNNGKNGKMF